MRRSTKYRIVTRLERLNNRLTADTFWLVAAHGRQADDVRDIRKTRC